MVKENKVNNPIDTDADPSPNPGATKLRKYWTRGEGAVKIKWGTPGDFNRCVRHLRKYVTDPKGLCFSGDTEFMTRDGVVKFEDVVGTKQLVLTDTPPKSGSSYGGRWVEADIEYFGVHEILEVVLTRNKREKVIRATPNHRWYASIDGKSVKRNTVDIYETAQLQPGMVLASLMPEPRLARTNISPFGIAAGFVYGDGNKEPQQCRVILWGEKDMQLQEYFAGCESAPVINKNETKGLRISGLPRTWKDAPNLDEGTSYLAGWLAGYIAADGTVSATGTVVLDSVDIENLQTVQSVANRLGIGIASIASNPRTIELPYDNPLNGTTQIMHRLTFAGHTFPAKLLLLDQHRENFSNRTNTRDRLRWSVKEVRKTGQVIDTYCAVVPDTHNFVLTDGIQVMNCNVYHRAALGAPPGHGHPGGKSLEDDITMVETLSYAQSLLNLDMSEFTKIFATINEKETKDDMQGLEHKNISVSSSGVTETTEDGVVEALVSVTGILDNVGDIIKPGAYEKTLQKRKAKGVWSHDWNTPVSRVEEIKELLPGDPSLPKVLANGDVWPSDAGALYVKAKFNLETQRGREAFSDVRFFGDDTEWSIGYKVPKNGAEKDDKTGIRTITELDLFEFSPVLFGAASNARSLVGAAKSLFDTEEEFFAEVKGVIGLKDAEIEEAPEHKCDTCNHEVEEEELVDTVEDEAKSEDVNVEATSVEENLPITAESLKQIKALHDQLGEVLALLYKEDVIEPEFKDNKSLRSAMDALIDGAYDSGVVQEIDDQIIGLEGAIKAMDSASIQSYANEALDEIQLALQDERATEQDIKDLKNLASAIGEAIQHYENTKPEDVAKEEPEPVIEEPKTISMSDSEWKAFLSDM